MSKDRTARRAAAQAEMERRWRETEKAAPISRATLQDLINFVADEIEAHGRDGTFRLAEAWLSESSVPAGPVLDFLRAHRVGDDYELVINGDPCKLFGPTKDRLAWMPIERTDLDALIDEVDRRCTEAGCDHSMRFTKEFLRRRALPLGTTVIALLAQGGGCDCEVVMNVEARSIYPNAAPQGRPEA